MTTPPAPCLSYCICNKSVVVSNQLKAKSAKVQCTICLNYFHAVCLKLANVNYKQFMCPECVVYRLDPLNKVVEVLYKPVPFQPSMHIPMKNLSFQVKYKDAGQAVEVRCIKLDGKTGSEEPTWPDIGELQLNAKKVVEFKPLQSNSSLKKRKDEKYTTADVQYNQTNIVQVKEGSPTQDQKSNCRVALGY